MRQVTNSRRSRNRIGRKSHSASKQHSFDSNGPDVKVRGSASQVAEKYLALARDALTSGDRIAAENYFQHAEHYFRVGNPKSNSDNARHQVSGNSSNGSQPGHGPAGNGSIPAVDGGGPQPSLQVNEQGKAQPNERQPSAQPDIQPSAQPSGQADNRPNSGGGEVGGGADGDEPETKPDDKPDAGKTVST